MRDSSDVKTAAGRLTQALKSLEEVLEPLASQYNHYKKQALEAETFVGDRTRLADELDESKAEAEELRSREDEFNRLADETAAELDNVIAKVRTVLERN